MRERKGQTKGRRTTGRPKRQKAYAGPVDGKGGPRSSVLGPPVCRPVPPVRGRRPRVPGPESELWPVWCRGKLWEWAMARFFVGRCQLCAYSCQPSEGRRRLDTLAGLPTFLLCTNHPDSPGQLRDVLPTQTCRNFKAKRWLRARVKPAAPEVDPPVHESDPRIRRIPLGHGRFATVDARDYKKLSRHKWCASNKSGRIYAIRRTKKGRIVYMHREIMNAPKGTVVDHINHNTQDNRRCNLRVVRPKENYANAGPRGAPSGFVGVWRQGNKWVAGINWRGKHYYLGRFDDPAEAARARDRKAYELHGDLAWLNFPDEIKRRRTRGGS